MTHGPQQSGLRKLPPSSAGGWERCLAEAIGIEHLCAQPDPGMTHPGLQPSSMLSPSEAQPQWHVASTPVGTNRQRLVDFQPVTLETDR